MSQKMTREQIKERIDQVNNRLFYLELADRMTPSERREYSDLNREIALLHKQLNQYEGQ